MPKVEFKRVQTDEEVENIDIKDGQLIYTGTGKTYMDYGSERIPTGSGGGSVDVDTEMSDTSENAVQNKVIKEYVDDQIEIGDTEPTSENNKIWIDTTEVGSAASEITNEYSESTGLGYSANYINNINTYSNTEQRVGTWFNKPLYKKTINITNIPTSTSNLSYQHNISNVDTIFIGAESFIYGTSNNRNHQVNSYLGTVSDYFNSRTMSAVIDNTNVYVYVGSYVTGASTVNMYITLYYTKTTD